MEPKKCMISANKCSCCRTFISRVTTRICSWKAALNEVRPTDSVLEIGTGCGVIAKRIAERARCVIATDKNPRAVENAKLNGVEAIMGDLFADLRQPV